MKLASILVAAAGVGLAGYALSAHFASESGPVAEVVTLPAAKKPEEVVVRTPVAQGTRATATPGDRASLARELQRELKRVGCYDGEISGIWTTSSRMAMKAFTDRVNASLPIDSPDYILLSLVQKHEGKACGTGCPGGQSRTEDGRCVPSAVLAKAGKAPAADEPRIVARSVGKPAETAADKPADRPDAGAGRYAPSAAGTTGDLRSPAISGSALLNRGERSASAAQGDPDPARTAAAKAEADKVPEPVPAYRERRTSKRAETRRPDGPVPEVGVYEDRPKKRKRTAKSKPPKVVQKFLRNVQRTLAGLPW